jgi:hypothetical protein
MRIYKGFMFLAGVAALSMGAVAPASAEFFGCHDKPGQVLYSYNGSPSDFRDRSYNSGGYSHYSGSSSYGSSSSYSEDSGGNTRYYRAGSSHATNYRSPRYRNDR